MHAKRKTLFDRILIHYYFSIFLSLFFQCLFFLIIILFKKNIPLGLLVVMMVIYLIELIYFSTVLKKRILYYRNLCYQFKSGIIYQSFITEAGDIFPDFDAVFLRIDQLIDRQKMLQLSQKQAEFLALQNQINPHFLYNTLESIRGDALLIGADDIANIAEALSTFFRYTISDTNNLVTIQNELDNVSSYFIIQQYRFGDDLSLKIEIPDEDSSLCQALCPKLFLQPIVENSVFHGLEQKTEKGTITIHIEKIDQNMHISISDDGVGIDEAMLNHLNLGLSQISLTENDDGNSTSKGGIALKNVCRRIRLLFGEEYGLHIDSVVGIGTKVEVILPILYKKNEKRNIFN